MKRLVHFAAAVLPAILFVSCDNLLAVQRHEQVLCPERIALAVESRALAYTAVPTRYLWGAQDEAEAEGPVRIDCSGLVVNCYRYSLRGTGYKLPFQDTTVAGFYENWTVPVSSPRAGDVIFISGSRWTKPTHMAIFVSRQAGNIWFIDSTYRPDENINGVTLRFWPEDDRRFHSFGRVILRH